MLNCIVEIINSSLKEKAFNDKRFQKVAAYKVSKSLPYKSEDSGQGYSYLPTEINDKGDGVALTPDDRFPVMVYHKMYSTANSNAPSQYGNSNDIVRRTFQMSMIIFAQRDKIKMSEDLLELNIIYGMPSKLSKTQLADLKLRNVTITLGSTDFNSLSLFLREYNTKKYYLKPSYLFFEMRYTIECDVHKACINTCKTC